jgi:hypothetical protein
MKNQMRPLVTLALVLTMLGATLNVNAQNVSTPAEPSAGPTTQGQLRPIRVKIPQNESATIEGAATKDAVSFQSGERFVVIVPQAFVASLQNDANSRDFLSVKIEQRGDDVEISFRLRPAGTARVVSQAGSLSIIFAPHQVALMITDGGANAGVSDSNRSVTNDAAATSAGNSNARRPSSPPAAPTLANPVSSVPPVPSSAAPVPQATPTLGNLLTQISGLIPGATKDLQASFSNIDLSVPESPAFTVLGVTPNAVVRPGTPREFASSLLNGLDKNGNFQTGLAIDTAPFMLFNGQNITLQDYNDYYLTRLLSRTQFSMAATKGAAADDTATRLALGLNITLWDKGDARVYHPNRGPEGDVLTCLKANIQPPDAPSSAMPSTAEIAAINAKAIAANNRIADECRDKVRKVNWNRTSWVIAYAPSWITKNGQTSNVKWNGGALWTSFAYGFDGVPSLNRIAQLILHARQRTKEQVADPTRAGQFVSQNSTFLGGRFRAGTADFALNFEGTYVRNRIPQHATFSSGRYAFGGEMKIADNLYIVVTGGHGPGDAGAPKKGFFMSSFKYGFNKKSQLNPQP